MSKEDLASFQTAVQSDPELLQRLQSKTNKQEFIDEAIRIGQKKGYNFTAKELTDHLNSSDSPTLSDDQLESGVGRPENYTYSKPGCQHH